MSLENRNKRNLVVAVTGASGALYGRELLRALDALVDGRSSLIVSPSALRVYREELGGGAHSTEDYLEEVLGPEQQRPGKHEFVIEEHGDIGARPASGSAPYDGMVVVPCSMKTLAGIAHGYTTSLVERAADVCLKERRTLILMPRETPLHLVHLRNMTTVTEAGAVVLPAAPGFYQGPQTLDDLARFIVGRVFNLLGLEHRLFRAWLSEES